MPSQAEQKRKERAFHGMQTVLSFPLNGKQKQNNAKSSGLCSPSENQVPGKLAGHGIEALTL